MCAWMCCCLRVLLLFDAVAVVCVAGVCVRCCLWLSLFVVVVICV